MDISIITETLNQNPSCYFIAGLIAGFLLKNLRINYRVKKPGRYQLAGDKNGKQKDTNSLSHEPYFDWADAAVKTLTSRQPQNAFDQHNKEV